MKRSPVRRARLLAATVLVVGGVALTTSGTAGAAPTAPEAPSFGSIASLPDAKLLGLPASKPNASSPSTAATGAAAAAANGKVAKVEYAKLYKLRAPHGNFWATREAERKSAIEDHGFTPLPTKLGSLLRFAPAEGFAVTRLRVCPPDRDPPCTGEGASNYLLTFSKLTPPGEDEPPREDERSKLVRSGKFVDEGVIGYCYKTQEAGTKLVWRVTNGHEWDVLHSDDAFQLLAKNDEDPGPDWAVDGPACYIPTRD